jgi:hypothetical protein
VRPPAGHAGTAADSDGQAAENRGLAEVTGGPERSRADPERQSVSALVAGAIAALDRGDGAEARALLRDVAARVALSGSDGATGPGRTYCARWPRYGAHVASGRAPPGGEDS